jgi:hypothetical protein
VLLTFDRDRDSLLYQRGLPAPGGMVYFRFVPFSLEEPAEYLPHSWSAPTFSYSAC